MDEDVGIAFPGQGGSWKAVVERLSADDDHPLVRGLLDRLGCDLGELRGVDTRHVQPSVYVGGLIGGERSGISLVTGHSLGEITAAAWAGAIDHEAGIDLLIGRAELAREAHRDRPGAMVAISRWPLRQIEQLRREAQYRGGGILDIAVINSADQIVLSGDRGAVDLAVAIANERGAVARLLPIDGAFHSSLLSGVLGHFRQMVDQAVTAAPSIALASSTSGRIITGREELVEILALGLVSAVDWPATLTAARAHGVTALIDMGPGDTLTRLGRHVDRPRIAGS